VVNWIGGSVNIMAKERMTKEMKEWIGTLGQYLSILVVGFAVGYGAGKGAQSYWIIVTFGIIIWSIFTKLKGK